MYQIRKVLDYCVLLIIRHYLYSATFLKILQSAIRERTLVSYFHFIIKTLSFFNYHKHNHKFSFGMHCCKPLTQALSNCVNFGSFNICRLKRNFTLSLDATHDHNWSFCFCISYTVDEPMFYEAINPLQFLSPSSLIIISRLCAIVNVMCFLLPAIPCLKSPLEPV
jgi:hypothetical protein